MAGGVALVSGSVWHDFREDRRLARLLRRGPGRRASSRGLLTLLVHRIAQRLLEGVSLRESPLLWPLLRVLKPAGIWLVAVLCKSEIASDTAIEPGVHLSGRGCIFIGARRIGRGTVIHEQVTIGARPITRGKPDIGRDVVVAPGCVIYGEVEIGDGATLLPGTVLSKSVPARCVVGGNPGRILQRDFDNAELRRHATWPAGFALGRAAAERVPA